MDSSTKAQAEAAQMKPPFLFSSNEEKSKGRFPFLSRSNDYNLFPNPSTPLAVTNANDSADVLGNSRNNTAFAPTPIPSATDSVTYTYDSLDRLTGVTYGSGPSISYSYDPAGNRTSIQVMGSVSTVTTSPGTNVTIQGSGTTISFANVTAGGITTITPINSSSTGQLPTGYQLFSDSVAFDIATSATTEGSVSVCFDVPSGYDQSAFSRLRVLHNEDGIWIDRTTGSDFGGRTICASVGSLGQFVLATTVVNQIQFNVTSYPVNEASPRVELAVSRLGETTGAASVKFVTNDNAGLQDCNVKNGIASPRCDYIHRVSTITFGGGETTKSVLVGIVDDSYAEGPETFTVSLSGASGAALGTQSTPTVTIIDNDSADGTNPLASNDFFIREHYIDFLGREPEPAGLQGWREILNNCGTTVAPPCDRIEVSSGFFRSEEFQTRGYFIYRFYSTVGKIPLYSDFTPDFAKVSGFLSAQQLEANKVTFVDEFMARQEFRNKYDSLTNPTAYVDGLLQTVGLPNHPTRGTWINGLTNGTLTRAQVLRALVESGEVYQKYYNEAFVIMQYFGYLRRTADASYLDWIQTMNQNGGDYRVMINGFMNSVEYRQRFGP